MSKLQIPESGISADPDPSETDEWRLAFDSVLQAQGPTRAQQILEALSERARLRRVDWKPELTTPYVNSISVEEQNAFPGDLAIEERLGALMRWNALAMVVRANQAYGELGGHIANGPHLAELRPDCLQKLYSLRRRIHLGGVLKPNRPGAPDVRAV